MCSLDGWSAQLLDNPQQMNTFQLVNTQIGTVYKFRTGSPSMTTHWLDSLRRDTLLTTPKPSNNIEKQLPVNLMTFE